MKVQYQRINAEVTPEALARLKKRKIVLESTEQSKVKGRYSIVIFDVYGDVTLDNENMVIQYNDRQMK